MARILVVDDEPAVRSIVKEVLTRAGHLVETVTNAPQALELLTSSEHFDLLITDVRMPGMSGVDLARRLRFSGVWIPIIAITAYIEDEAEAAFSTLEALRVRVIVKPFGTLQLRDAVEWELEVPGGSSVGENHRS